MKKIIFNIFILILLICPFFVNAEEYKYTIDDASLLKKDTKEYIDKYSDFLNYNNNFKYYVVTVKTLGVYDLEELTEDYYNQLNIGKNGILILYVKDKQALRIKAGNTISEVIDDELLEKHINIYFMPFLKNSEVDQGILNGYKSLYKVVCNYYNIDSTEMEVYYADNLYEKYKSYIIMFLIWVNTATTIIICDINKKFYSKKKKATANKQFMYIASYAINIFVLFIAYFMNPTTMLLILGFELFAITSSYSSGKQLDLNDIKRIEYKKELKRKRKAKIIAKKKEALRLKQLKKMQKNVKKRNKKIKKTSSDVDKMLIRAKHK